MRDILIVMNNYLHDLATAVLLAATVIMYALGRHARTADGYALLARMYRTLTGFAWGALAWIVIGGIPRVIFFRTHEFIPAAERGLVVALGVKHAVMFSAVVLGVVLWRAVKRDIERLSADSSSSGGLAEDTSQ